MRIVFPGVPDATQHLDAVLRASKSGARRERGGDRDAQRSPIDLDTPIIRGPRRVPDSRPGCLDRDGHIGASMFHRLELADRPAELAPIARVPSRSLETPLRDTDRLGAGQDRREPVDVGLRCKEVALIKVESVEVRLGQTPGRVEARHLTEVDEPRVEHDPPPNPADLDRSNHATGSLAAPNGVEPT